MKMSVFVSPTRRGLCFEVFYGNLSRNVLIKNTLEINHMLVVLIIPQTEESTR